MVAGQFVEGLANAEPHDKVLTEGNSLTTMEQKFNRLASPKTTKKSTPHLQRSGSPRVKIPLNVHYGCYAKDTEKYHILMK